MPTKQLTPLEIAAIRRGAGGGNVASIVGITGTKADFNTALIDGDFLFVGDIISGGTFNIDDGSASSSAGFILDDGSA